jgi:hypothetical protein
MQNKKKRANKLFDLFFVFLLSSSHYTKTKIRKNSGLMKKLNYQKALRCSSLQYTVRFLQESFFSSVLKDLIIDL